MKILRVIITFLLITLFGCASYKVKFFPNHGGNNPPSSFDIIGWDRVSLIELNHRNIITVSEIGESVVYSPKNWEDLPKTKQKTAGDIIKMTDFSILMLAAEKKEDDSDISFRDIKLRFAFAEDPRGGDLVVKVRVYILRPAGEEGVIFADKGWKKYSYSDTAKFKKELGKLAEEIISYAKIPAKGFWI